LGILPRFSEILPKILKKQNFWGCSCAPCTPTSYTTVCSSDSFCRIHAFPTEKTKRFCRTFFDFQNRPSAPKKSEFENLASNNPNWQPGCLVSMIL